MIVNLKHLKKQWSELPPFGITYIVPVCNPNPRKILHALTAIQLWLQLLSLLLLVNCCLDQWYTGHVDNGSKSTKNTNYVYGYGKAYFIGSLVFQMLDIIVTVYASYHLRNATSMYNYIQEVNTWTMVNNIYLTTSVMCFIYIFSKSRSFVVCLRVITTCLFTAYKIYIVYQLYKCDKSSNLVLEQNVVLLESPLKPTNNENSASSESPVAPSHVVVELGTNTETGEDNHSEAPINSVDKTDQQQHA